MENILNAIAFLIVMATPVVLVAGVYKIVIGR